MLKIEPDGEESENAACMMAWLEGMLPAARLIATQKEKGLRYTLMTRVPGEMACSPRYIGDPSELIRLLAEGMRMLWTVDVSDCPVCCMLDDKLRRARLNVENGLVDVDNTDPETFGPGGFEGPAQLLEWLCENRPQETPVLSHGDFTLPNVFIENGRISGFIDLGRAGTADRWQDIALCWRSLRDNANGRFGAVYDGFDDGMLFDALDIAPDWEKIRYYLLLDELF